MGDAGVESGRTEWEGAVKAFVERAGNGKWKKETEKAFWKWLLERRETRWQ